MTFFKDIIQQVLPSPEKIPVGREPLQNGPLKRDDKFIAEYEAWKKSERPGLISESVHKSFQEALSQHVQPTAVGIYKDRGIQGIVIYNKLDVSKKEYHFLLDFLKHKLPSLNYMYYRGVIESKEINRKIYTKEEYYHKPRPSSTELPVSQGFGNITLQLNIVNEEVLTLKVIVTTYSGYNYKEPKPFEELIRYLFTEK